MLKGKSDSIYYRTLHDNHHIEQFYVSKVRIRNYTKEQHSTTFPKKNTMSRYEREHPIRGCPIPLSERTRKVNL